MLATFHQVAGALRDHGQGNGQGLRGVHGPGGRDPPNADRRPARRATRGSRIGRPGNGWFSPLANVAESENEYEVTVDLPGLKP